MRLSLNNYKNTKINGEKIKETEFTCKLKYREQICN